MLLEFEFELNNVVGDFFGFGIVIDMDVMVDDGGISVFVFVFLDFIDFNASRGLVIGFENKLFFDGCLVILNKLLLLLLELELNNFFGFFGVVVGGFVGVDVKGAGADVKGVFLFVFLKRLLLLFLMLLNNLFFDL